VKGQVFSWHGACDVCSWPHRRVWDASGLGHARWADIVRQNDGVLQRSDPPSRRVQSLSNHTARQNARVLRRSDPPSHQAWLLAKWTRSETERQSTPAFRLTRLLGIVAVQTHPVIRHGHWLGTIANRWVDTQRDRTPEYSSVQTNTVAALIAFHDRIIKYFAVQTNTVVRHSRWLGIVRRNAEVLGHSVSLGGYLTIMPNNSKIECWSTPVFKPT